LSSQPPLQSLKGKVVTVEMAETECVNDGTFGAVKANPDIVDPHGFPANVESLGSESVPRNRCSSTRRARCPRECDVDARRVLVGEVVAS
jgi:hypothetical protein